MAKKTFLNEMIKASGSEYASIPAFDVNLADVKDYVDTGSYLLNALVSASIYKGFPGNKVTSIAGPSGVGKTYIAISAVRAFQETYNDGLVVYYDSEAAVTTDMLESRGVDTSRIAVIPVATIESFRTECVRMLNAYNETPEKDRPPMLFVLDSLGNLSTNKETGDIADGKDTVDLTKSKLVKGAFRTIALKLAKANCALLLTNHTYETLEMFSKQVMGGGTGPVYNSSTVIFCNKGKEKEGTDVVGTRVSMTNVKSRFTKEQQKIYTVIRFDSGLDPYYGLIDIAVKHGVLEKSGNRVVMPDGTKVYESVVYKEPEKYFTDELLGQINEACEKEFSYGSDIDTEVEEQVVQD